MPVSEQHFSTKVLPSKIVLHSNEGVIEMVVETRRAAPYAVELNEKTLDIFVRILEQLNLHLAVFLLFIAFHLFDFV